MIVQYPKQSLQLFLCLRMDEPQLFLAFQKVFQGLAVGIGISKIRTGRTDSVHHHLRHIPSRHLRSHDHMLSIQGIIHPVFKMMLVSALMMQPGGGYPDILPFSIVGTPCSLIIFASDQKFRRMIFRQIVEQALLIQPDTEAIPHDHKFMFRNCFKMQPWMHAASSPTCQAAQRWCAAKFESFSRTPLPLGKIRAVPGSGRICYLFPFHPFQKVGKRNVSGLPMKIICHKDRIVGCPILLLCIGSAVHYPKRRHVFS